MDSTSYSSVNKRSYVFVAVVAMYEVMIEWHCLTLCVGMLPSVCVTSGSLRRETCGVMG